MLIIHWYFIVPRLCSSEILHLAYVSQILEREKLFFPMRRKCSIFLFIFILLFRSSRGSHFLQTVFRTESDKMFTRRGWQNPALEWVNRLGYPRVTRRVIAFYGKWLTRLRAPPFVMPLRSSRPLLREFDYVCTSFPPPFKKNSLPKNIVELFSRYKDSKEFLFSIGVGSQTKRPSLKRL